MNSDHSPAEILDIIRCYASAYHALQQYQEKSPLIPKGDQKTGCIGEFYVYLYLKSKYSKSTISYGGHSQKGWDISVTDGLQPLKVQVKTVSAYSTTRSMSPIHYGWNELHVVYLSKEMKPEGFWIIGDRNRNIVSKNTPLKGKKCPDPASQQAKGSGCIPFGENRINDLRKVLNTIADMEDVYLAEDP